MEINALEDSKRAIRELAITVGIKHVYTIKKGTIKLLLHDGIVSEAHFIFFIDEKNVKICPCVFMAFPYNGKMRYITHRFDGKGLKQFYKNAFSNFKKGMIELDLSDFILSKQGDSESFKKQTISMLGLGVL